MDDSDIGCFSILMFLILISAAAETNGLTSALYMASAGVWLAFNMVMRHIGRKKGKK